MSLAPSDVKSRNGTAGPKADTIPQKSKAHFSFGGNGPALGAATVFMLMFMGATLPGPLYLIYRDELHFSQVTLTLIYAVYFASAVLTAFFLGRLSDRSDDAPRSCSRSVSACSAPSCSSLPIPSRFCSSRASRADLPSRLPRAPVPPGLPNSAPTAAQERA